MSHHEEEGARFGYDGEQLAEDIRKEFQRRIQELREAEAATTKAEKW